MMWRRLLIGVLALVLIVGPGAAVRPATAAAPAAPCEHHAAATDHGVAHHDSVPDPAAAACADCCIACVPTLKLPGATALTRSAVVTPVRYATTATRRAGRSLAPEPAPPRPSA